MKNKVIQNVNFCVDAKTGIILGIKVIQDGNFWVDAETGLILGIVEPHSEEDYDLPF